MRKPKILFLDIEATNLAANYGFVICVGYKLLGQKRVNCPTLADFPHSFGRDCTNDSKLLSYIEKPIQEADLIVTWYGKKYDIPYLQTRRLLQGKKPFKIPSHLDLWETARKHLKFHSNRLDTVSRAIPQRFKERKTPIESIHWIRGAAGHRPSINYIKKHCIADIKVLEQVYKKMLPFVKNHPHIGWLVDPREKGNRRICPNCMSRKVIKNGLAASRAVLKQVWYCKACKTHYETRYVTER